MTERTGPAAVLVGPPGAGKSTVGAALARKLGVSFVDVDQRIAARAGRSIPDIFTSDGEDTFRELERAEVRAALADHKGVLGLGGGAVLAEETRQVLQGHTVVFLSVGLTEGVRRTGLSKARPLLAGMNPRATFRTLLEQRLPLYREVATIEVETEGRSVSEVADAIVAELTRTSA